MVVDFCECDAAISWAALWLCDLSAWLGLTPRPHSTGGKERLGRTSKMGNRNQRRLLYLGTIAEVSAGRRGEAGTNRLWQIICRKKPKQAAIALANTRQHLTA